MQTDVRACLRLWEYSVCLVLPMAYVAAYIKCGRQTLYTPSLLAWTVKASCSP